MKRTGRGGCPTGIANPGAAINNATYKSLPQIAMKQRLDAPGTISCVWKCRTG